MTRSPTTFANAILPANAPTAAQLAAAGISYCTNNANPLFSPLYVFDPTAFGTNNVLNFANVLRTKGAAGNGTLANANFIGGQQIRNASVTMPDLTEAESDGVVNSALQIPFRDEATAQQGLEQVAALVLADHLDVVGAFPMADSNLAEESGANEFLNSGSVFRGREFSELYRSIAYDIARAT